jgi:hypothetical protein
MRKQARLLQNNTYIQKAPLAELFVLEYTYSMKNKTTALGLVVLGLVIILAVFIYSKVKVQAPTVSSTPTQSVKDTTYASLDLASIQTAAFKDTSNPVLDIHGTYPVQIVGSDYIKGQIDAAIAQFKKDAIDPNLTPEQLSEFGPSATRQYTFVTNYKNYKDSQFLTHRIDTYIFTGGAHGNTIPVTYTYDTAGNRVMLNDLFVNDAAKTQFGKIVYDAALTLPDYKDSINTEWLAGSTENKEGNFETFAFSGSTIVIIFPQYAIAPYSSGIIEVPVQLSALSGILKPAYLK